MKNRLKKLMKVIMICSFVILTSCEKDLYEDSIKSERKMVVQPFSINELSSKSNSKLMDAMNLLKSTTKDDTNRIVYDSIYNFYYDDENGLYISSDGNVSYTFPVFRNNLDDKIENILFDLNTSGSYDVYLVKYDLTKEELLTLTEEQFLQLDKDYTALIIDGRVPAPELVCIDIQELQLVSNQTVSGSVSQPDYHWEWVTVGSMCNWVGGGGGNSQGNDNPPNSTTTTASGQNGGGGIGISGIITAPIAMTPAQLAVKDFVNNLTQTQLDWYNEHTESQESINSLVASGLNQNGDLYSEIVVQIIDSVINTNIPIEFANDMFESLIYNSDIDIPNNIIYTINKPCQKQIIKNILDSCSPLINEINQTFNTTDKVNLKFITANIPDGSPAYTNSKINASDGSITVTITFDNTYLTNATNLSIAMVTLHELVHAYLINLYFSGQLVASNAEFNTLLNAFMVFYDNQVDDTFTTLDNEIHNAMIFFIEKMANSVYNYSVSNNIPNVTPEYCTNLVWGGMYGYSLFLTILTPEQQINHGNTAAIEQDHMQGCKGTPCN